MTGCLEDVPDPDRRRAANAALTGIIEEVCRHYAPSGARIEDCWEVREAGDRLVLRVFLAGPMQGSWTEAGTGARGDALDLVARLSGLDAAGALAEAERFLSRRAAGPERKAEDAGGQMALFGTLPEGRERNRPVRRSGRGRNAGASRRAAAQHEPPAGASVPHPGEEPESVDDATVGSQSSPGASAPEDRKAGPMPADPAKDAGPGLRESGPPATEPDGVAFSDDDRQRLRRIAVDAAWTRSHLSFRSLDASAHERAKRQKRHGRRWRRSGLKAAMILALAVFGPALGAMGEYRYGVVDLASVLGAELAEDARILPGGDGE